MLITKGIILQLFAKEAEKIVNIGCYTAEMFGEYATNVDIRSLDEIREHYKSHGGTDQLIIPNFVQADAQNLPFEDKEFDCSVMGEVLEHVDDPKQVLLEAKRVASLILISVPNEYEWHPELKPFQNPEHKRYFDENSIMRLVESASIGIIQVIKIRHMGWSFIVVAGIDHPDNIHRFFPYEKFEGELGKSPFKLLSDDYLLLDYKKLKKGVL